MTGKVVNLRRARKRKARAQPGTEAGANAARHGESGPARALRRAQDDLAARQLEGHQLTDHGRNDADDCE